MLCRHAAPFAFLWEASYFGLAVADDSSKECLPKSASSDIPFAEDVFFGWYDVQGCGRCLDYCGWTSLSPPPSSGGDPSDRLEYGDSWWSCRLAGTSSGSTQRDHFEQFLFSRCMFEGAEALTVDEDDLRTKQDTSAEGDAAPGAVQLALAVVLTCGLICVMVHVGRMLRKISEMSPPVRHVPEGLRTAQCGVCQTVQYISLQGRAFVCHSCQAANRIPVVVHQADPQLLAEPTGPISAYVFRKGGDNYWQEVKHEELPDFPVGEAATEAEKLHYKGRFCLACDKESCGRLLEFPEGTAVARLPEASAEADKCNNVQPAVIGSQSDRICGTFSTMSSKDFGGIPLCVVCLDGPGSVVLLPCTHGSVCEECATRIAQNRATGGAHCPHCRSGIERLVKIHKVTGETAHGIELRIPIARVAASESTSPRGHGGSPSTSAPSGASARQSPRIPWPAVEPPDPDAASDHEEGRSSLQPSPDAASTDAARDNTQQS